MFGFRYLKTDPTTFVLHYRSGKVARAGLGLSFFYFAPNSSIVAVPAASVDVPFIFKGISEDFQEVSVQGSFVYRIKDPRKTAALVDFSVRPVAGRLAYTTQDPEKLPGRITNIVQVSSRVQIQQRNLKQCLQEADVITSSVLGELRASGAMEDLGIEIIDFNILAIKPTPETAKALEAEMREALLRQSDSAVYERRNASIEQERRIKENELQTELHVAEKQREIKEKQMQTLIAVEEQRRQLIEAKAQNIRQEADAKGYSIAAQLRPFVEMEPEALKVITAGTMDPKLVIGTAFKELAENARNIGTLNITPDLLGALLDEQGKKAA